MSISVTLDLPAPPSVNRTRRVDWTMMPKFGGWTRSADALVLAAKCRSRDPVRLRKVKRFEIKIVLSETLNDIDLDNGIKWLIDYCRRIELIEDDSKRHMRRVVVEWGVAPEGARITVTPLQE